MRLQHSETGGLARSICSSKDQQFINEEVPCHDTSNRHGFGNYRQQVQGIDQKPDDDGGRKQIKNKKGRIDSKLPQ